MHLVRLEAQGFKTFAKKTSLQFLPPKGDHKPLTAVVGPNGSGKSNIADAIRWALGEQSMKALRGKKSEDIIFSGSEGKGRSGFAEVSLTFDNRDKAMPIEFEEVTVTRRVYRDGEGEYLLNGAAARLSDIQLLLAQANVGQRSYSVVGQGMVDHILVASPEERKAFFDDATGVRQFQIKRHEAMLKLKRTYENLAEVGMLLQEIEPRLRSLRRQANRLQERAEVETELRGLERGYYGTLWWKVMDELAELGGKKAKADQDVQTERTALQALEAKVNALEKEEKSKDTQDTGLAALQTEYRKAQQERNRVRDAQHEIQKQIELGKIRAQSSWAPLPLTQIIEELNGLEKELAELKSLKDLEVLISRIDGAFSRTGKLVRRLQRPAPEDAKPDPALVEKLNALEKERMAAEGVADMVEKKLEGYATAEKKVRTDLFDLQRDLRERERNLHAAENRRNGFNIEAARLEERRDNLHREMEVQLKEVATGIKAERPASPVDTGTVYPNIQRLRYKLELIGGIDPETVKEFEETQSRFTFLEAQVKDLNDAAGSTEKALDELDKDIKEQSEGAFKDINKEFQRFFKILFGGGSCNLVQLTRDDLATEEEGEPAATSQAQEEQHHEIDTASDLVRDKIKAREDRIVGIDIQATPPGKRLKALNLLSGGERALTSIALVAAIMAVNPAPFVVLDEVDAALDEANTYRFAAILQELAKLTQFIVITHNRATMEKADVLYGVTMGDDGISNLISVKLEELGDVGAARR